ncbi:f-box protein, partial [Nicotiana attenuata]
NSLVSNLSFVGIHQNRSIYRPNKAKFIARSRKNNFYTIDLDVEHREAYVLRIQELHAISYLGIGYIEGLFCLWNALEQPPIIYNPTTRKARSLPVDDEIGHYHYSLGFEPDNKKYKILRYNIAYIPKRYWVITIGTSESWREIKSVPYSLSLPAHGGVCIDGAIYFLGGYKNKVRLVAFNVRTENFKIISLWKDLQYMPGDRSFHLIGLEDKLAAIDYSIMIMEEMDLWILERSDSSEEWGKHTIAFPHTLSSTTSYVGIRFCRSTTDGEIVLINSNLKQNWIFFYDLKKKSWRDIEIKEITGEKVEIMGIYSY